MRALPFVLHDVAQQSDAWFAIRLGKLTGSRAADALATIKSGEAAARRDYRMQLVCERLTNQPQENGFVNDIMLRGIEKEPLARAVYESMTGHLVQESGFLVHPTLPAGGSLDGAIEDFRGILEIKCPKSSTHLRYLREGKLPKEHESQVMHGLWLTGAEWCDFFSFDDRFPAPLQTFRIRVLRTDLNLAWYEAEAIRFLDEVEREYRSLVPLEQSLMDSLKVLA